MERVITCCLDMTRGKHPTWTASTCVHFMKDRAAEVEEGAGADAVYETILHHFKKTPPTDGDMAQLSLLHQHHSGSHGIYDYACTTVFLCAQESLLDAASLKGSTLGSIKSFTELCR